MNLTNYREIFVLVLAFLRLFVSSYVNFYEFHNYSNLFYLFVGS